VSDSPPVRLRLSELRNWAGLLTLSRLPLAICFPFLGDRPRLFLGVYALALLTDALDGIVARRTGTTSHTGSVLDGWLDKVLHVNAAWTMALRGWVPGEYLIPWFARELIQAPMVVWLVPAFHRGQVRPHHASLLGKLATWLLAAAFIATLLGAALPSPSLRALVGPLTAATGLSGAAAALGYLRRELEDRRGVR
jgi:cardiolipin synthase (CMP-forming)